METILCSLDSISNRFSGPAAISARELDSVSDTSSLVCCSSFGVFDSLTHFQEVVGVAASIHCNSNPEQ